MKRFFIGALILTLFFCCKAQVPQYQVVTVGFYNLENLFDTMHEEGVEDEEFTPEGGAHYTPEVYHDKLGKLSQVISEIGTDDSPDGVALLGVAEVENHQVLEDLVNMPKLKDRHYQIAHIEGHDERGIDAGLLYNPKYFTVKKMESLHVATEKIDSTYGRTRDVLFVTGEFLGEPLFVFVNHWPSRRGGEEASRPYRALAASVNKHKIDSLMKIDPNTKVIVMGDLNDDPTNESVAKVLDAKGYKEDVKPGGLYNPWVYLYKKGIGTLAYNDSWDLFDQIMISSAFLPTTQSGFYFKKQVIFKRDYMIEKTGRYKGYPKRTYNGNIYAGGYSDHFPTYIVLMKSVKK